MADPQLPLFPEVVQREQELREAHRADFGTRALFITSLLIGAAEVMSVACRRDYKAIALKAFDEAGGRFWEALDAALTEAFAYSGANRPSELPLVAAILAQILPHKGLLRDAELYCRDLALPEQPWAA